MTDFEWQKECVYISNLTDQYGLTASMNYDTTIAIRYCEMQRNTAKREGFHDSATYIQHCIDDLKSYMSQQKS